MLSGVVTNASEKSVCPFPDVDERGLPPAKKRKTKFSQQAHLIKALCDGGYVAQLIPIAKDKALRCEWWRKHRSEVFELVPEEYREKFHEAHAIKSAFEMEIASADERERYFKQSLGHLSRLLHSGMWESEHFHALVDEDDPAAIELLPVLTKQALERSAETMQRVSSTTRELIEEVRRDVNNVRHGRGQPPI